MLVSLTRCIISFELGADFMEDCIVLFIFTRLIHKLRARWRLPLQVHAQHKKCAMTRIYRQSAQAGDNALIYIQTAREGDSTVLI